MKQWRAWKHPSRSYPLKTVRPMTLLGVGACPEMCSQIQILGLFVVVRSPNYSVNWSWASLVQINDGALHSLKFVQGE